MLPIVNENDTVATSEIRFGDNDRLAALVAHLVHADLLVLLSDVDGLYDGHPAAAGSRLVADVALADDLAGVRIGSAGAAGLGTGGMRTKLEAARIATGAGIPVVLTSADQAGEALAGEPVGTLVPRRRPAPADPPAVAGARHRAARACCCSTRAPSAPSPSAGPRCCAAGLTGVDRLVRRRRPGRPGRPRRRRRSRAGWSTSTPTRSRALVGKTSAELRRELGRGVRARGRAPRRPRAARPAAADPAAGVARWPGAGSDA